MKTSFKRFESKPVVKIILIYDRLNLWRHLQFITIFYQFLHIRIEIIHGSHMYIVLLSLEHGFFKEYSILINQWTKVVHLPHPSMQKQNVVCRCRRTTGAQKPRFAILSDGTLYSLSPKGQSEYHYFEKSINPHIYIIKRQ
jgi:hypothetical protein